MPSHYQTLGVPPSASAGEIRTAYRDLARRLHPDHHRLRSPAEAALAERRMRDVNEAWRVLGDRDRRGRYDADRRPSPSFSSFSGQQARSGGPGVPRTPSAVDADDLVDVAPEMGPVQAHVIAGLPWVVLLVVFGLIFVVTAYASADRDPDPAAPVVSSEEGRMGSCLRVDPGPATVSVPCDGDEARPLVARVEPDGECPAGSEPRRLGDDGRIDCLAPA